jgi:transposase
LRAELPRILGTSCADLSSNMAQIIEDLASDWRRLDERIDRLSAEIEALARQDAGCERLMSVPGADHLQRDGGCNRRRRDFP